MNVLLHARINSLWYRMTALSDRDIADCLSVLEDAVQRKEAETDDDDD